MNVAPDNKVPFVEFLDFECESCRAAYPAVEQLRKDYAGRVTFVVRYFPIPSHFNAERAARAVEAASKQGKFELGGLIGLAASAVLTVEKIAILRDPAYVPSCSINPVLSCGSVMTKPQAEAFGFPNPLLGIAGFAVVATVGAALLAGATVRRWFWLGLQAGVTFGVGFVHWLIFQSLYRIGALCPYCMIVWAVTIPIFWYVMLHNLRRRFSFHGVALTLWFVLVLALITEQFWSYWRSLG